MTLEYYRFTRANALNGVKLSRAGNDGAAIHFYRIRLASLRKRLYS